MGQEATPTPDLGPVTCLLCDTVVEAIGRPMREHVSTKHPEDYPNYIDVQTGAVKR